MRGRSNNGHCLIFNDKCRLVLLSFLMLFVELTLVRWSGSNIYYLFFFSNYVLLASFLGIGISFIRSKSHRRFFYLSPIFLAIVVFCCYRYSYQYQPRLNSETGNLNYYGSYFKDNIYPQWFSLPLIFISVTAVMASLADGVARTFQLFKPLQAYRLEVIGSLTGIVTFSILSFFHATPIWWGIIITLIFLPFLKKNLHHPILLTVQLGALVVMLATFGKESITPNHFWSAYYKIEVQPYSNNQYVVNVNGLAQQVIETVRQRQTVKPFYFLPYQHRLKQNALDNVLIIGSGTGGDVAIALAEGARHIDAVEIDPMLYRLGKQFNPDRPYQDPRVTIHINDGRAFLQQTSRQYDMIIFALTDSLMLIPGQASLRLENYLYTLESISRVYQLLKPDGLFTIYNYYHAPWLVDRLANTLAHVFKQPPCLDTFGVRDYWATVLTISPRSSTLQCPTRWQPVLHDYSAPATDNHPFLYLMENTLPFPYLITLGFILLFSLSLIRITNGSLSPIRNYPDLFLMGAAFLLLETKSVIHFALLFGTTWFVNALVFMGILFAVYLAVEVTSRVKTLSLSFLYIALLLFLCSNWLIPNSILLMLPKLARFAIAAALAFGPIFIANLIFAKRFRYAIDSTEAFGANLLGAMTGGILEYASLVVGYKNLLILILVLYTIAIIFMPSEKAQQTSEA